MVKCFSGRVEKGQITFTDCMQIWTQKDTEEYSFNPQLSLQILWPLLGILLQSVNSSSSFVDCALRCQKQEKHTQNFVSTQQWILLKFR